MNPTLLKMQDDLFVATSARGIVPFPRDIPSCNALNATPYLVSMTRFRDTLGNSRTRLALLDRLDDTLRSADQLGAPWLALLVGGSFLDATNANPHDIDGVCFHAAGANGTDATALLALWQAGTRKGIDVRFVPFDANPLMALKACSFFTTLYARTRSSPMLSRGCLLVYPEPGASA